MNAERIEQARRFGGELCEIDGCPELGTLEHVTAHLAATAAHGCAVCGENPATRADGTPRLPLQHRYGPTGHDYLEVNR
jgi:hypothetical protein